MLIENKTVEPKVLSYKRNILYQTDEFELVSIDWNDKSISPMHSHGWSQCLVLVEEGRFENILNLGCKTEVQILDVGQVLYTPAGAKHEIRCLSAKGKSLHIYAPKITELPETGTFKVTNMDSLKADLQLSEPTHFEALRKILESIRQHSISTHSPYFMNQLFAGAFPQMLIAEELISQTKSTMATYEASPTFSAIEAQVVEALCEQVGWSKGKRDGVCVPGGSAANFMAIHCARQKRFPDFKKKGMNGASLKVYVSSEAHYSFKKACAVLGLGMDNLVQVPSDEHGRIKPQALVDLIQQHEKQNATPLLVCATAGTTVLGAFDSITELSAICKKHGAWLHVDGAWGGPAIFSKKLMTLMQGIELADSFTFDAHKLLGASLTCSFFLTQHQGLLLEANDVSGGDYLFHSDDETIDRGKLSWQCGRKADALSFWTIWKNLGTEGIGQFVDRLLVIRDQTTAWVSTQPRLKLVASPDYLNVCIRVLPTAIAQKESAADWSRKVRESLREKNLAMVNYSTDSQGSFLRLILAHPYLQFEHIKRILEWALAVE